MLAAHRFDVWMPDSTIEQYVGEVMPTLTPRAAFNKVHAVDDLERGVIDQSGRATLLAIQ
jgi:hypothetical protein